MDVVPTKKARFSAEFSANNEPFQHSKGNPPVARPGKYRQHLLFRPDSFMSLCL